MMMATGGGDVFVTVFVPLCCRAEILGRRDRFERGAGSGDDVGNYLVLDLCDPVLDDQFLLLHPLYAQGIAACLDHCVDRDIVILMFLPQPRYA
jgi:hypothetical protein